MFAAVFADARIEYRPRWAVSDASSATMPGVNTPRVIQNGERLEHADLGFSMTQQLCVHTSFRGTIYGRAPVFRCSGHCLCKRSTGR